MSTRMKESGIKRQCSCAILELSTVDQQSIEELDVTGVLILIEIFCCYSYTEEEWLRKLEILLDLPRWQGFISLWFHWLIVPDMINWIQTIYVIEEVPLLTVIGSHAALPINVDIPYPRNPFF